MAGAAVCPGASLHIAMHSTSLLIIDMKPVAVHRGQAGVLSSVSKHVLRAFQRQVCQKRMYSSGSRGQR